MLVEVVVKSGKTNSWLFKNAGLSQLVIMKYSVVSESFRHWFWKPIPFKISISFGERIILLSTMETL